MADEIVWCLISQTQLEIYDHITTEYECVSFLYKNSYRKPGNLHAAITDVNFGRHNLTFIMIPTISRNM